MKEVIDTFLEENPWAEDYWKIVKLFLVFRDPSVRALSKVSTLVSNMYHIYIYRFLTRFLFLHFSNNRLSPYIITWYIGHFITIYIRGFGVYYWISKCFLMCSFCLFYCISPGTGVACCSKSNISVTSVELVPTVFFG